jgi:DNA-binding NtrC family response regulator
VLLSGFADDEETLSRRVFGPAQEDEPTPAEDFERMLIDNAMRRHKGRIVSVMDELCIPRRTLNEKMTKYRLQLLQRSDYL